jgi:hypothetical protein
MATIASDASVSLLGHTIGRTTRSRQQPRHATWAGAAQRSKTTFANRPITRRRRCTAVGGRVAVGARAVASRFG